MLNNASGAEKIMKKIISRLKFIRKKFTYSRTSPGNDRRGCICPDGRTYHRDCCDGSLQAQGIGKILQNIMY